MASNLIQSAPDLETTPKSSTSRSYQRLAVQLLDLITDGEFKIGERLPSERGLAERFGVSRTSVREAMIALELQGAVEVRLGSGIYVTQENMASVCVPSFVPEIGPGPFELLRARCVIESEIASVAAEMRKDSDLDQIFLALTDMGKHLDDKESSDAADRLFHLGIAESTGNSVLLQMVTSLWDQARGPLWSQMESHFHSPALRAASQDDHQRVFNAILKRDSAGARSAMRAHLERVMGEFAQAWR